MSPKSRIDLNLLAVFDAVYTRGSATLAAQHLNLSQSAVSHALARLRREFDDPLFVRSGNALVPTTLAREIAGPVGQAMQGIARAMAQASQFDPATTTRAFRIGLRPTIEAQLFADLVRRVAHEAPHARLASVDFRRARLARTLATGALDLALDIPGTHCAGLRSVELRREDLVVVYRRDHPRMGEAIDLATYVALDHVIASPRTTGGGPEDEALAALGHERRITVRCQHGGSAWQIVATTDLLLTTSRVHAEEAAAAAGLRIVPLPFAVPPRPLLMLWHEATDRDAGAAWLREMVAGMSAPRSSARGGGIDR